MTPQSSQAQTLRRLWWMNPILAFIGVPGLTLLAAIALPQRTYDVYAAPKFLTPAHFLVFVAAILAIGVGYLLATRIGQVPKPTPESWDPLLRKACLAAIGLTLFGYAAWLGVGVKNGFRPGMIKQIITGQKLDSEDIKQKIFTTIPGVTTCTQFGIAAVVLGMWLMARGDNRFLLGVAVVLGLAAVRAVIVSERLALIELMVPTAILLLRGKVMGQSVMPITRTGLQLAPILAVIGLFITFGFFEYFRSWQFYKDQYNSIVEFTAERILGYYATSHNNGAMAFIHRDAAPFPYFSLQMLWEFPLVDKTPLGYKNLMGFEGEKWQFDLLENYANPELNSYGGLFWPAVDFGGIGFLVYWTIFGYCAGKTYRGFLIGTAIGMFFFPLIFLAILESPRFLYLSTVRGVPSFAFLCMVMTIGNWQAYCRQLAPNVPPLGLRALIGFAISFVSLRKAPSLGQESS